MLTRSAALTPASHKPVAIRLTTLLCALEPQVKELLEIPDGIATAATVALGYPARPFPKRLARRPLADTCFLDAYGDPLGA